MVIIECETSRVTNESHVVYGNEHDTAASALVRSNLKCTVKRLNDQKRQVKFFFLNYSFIKCVMMFF